MPAPANAIKSSDLKKVREVEFTFNFVDTIKKLMEALGTTRKIAMKAGTVLESVKVTGRLENGTVGELEEIPLSKYQTELVSYKKIALKKWRKMTSIEAIAEKGYNQAVVDTNNKAIDDAQNLIRDDLFAALAEGTGTAEGVGLQEALANAWGELQVVFENTSANMIYFLNPKDIAKYLGKAQLTMQTAFGMSYIENFLGLGTVITNSEVPEGSFYATAKDNLILYYLPMNSTDLEEAFEFRTDETGYIGIHEGSRYSNTSTETVFVTGITFFPERADGIVVGTINPAPAAA